jgi:hypothetical protein
MIVSLLLGLWACQEPSGGPEPLDLRVSPPAATDGSVVLLGPDFVVEPYTEVMFCIFGTWEEEEQGMVAATTLQDTSFGHHAILMGTTVSPITHPDGTMLDCTEGSDMVDMEPMIMVEPVEQGVTEMTLPDGMAMKLKQGQRWVLQSHYVNPTEDFLRVRDVVELDLVEPAEVTTWAAPLVLVETDLVLPPGETTTISFDCAVEEELNLLYLLGHMHEWGTAFSTDHKAGETVERIYDVQDWDLEFRDEPPRVGFGETGRALAIGDVLTTTCTWENDTDEDLVFPYEMCASVGIAWPLTVPLICDPD